MYKFRGFTLIELSIVIVIIGLIVAGVVGGQQLVNSAKLRTVMQDVEQYTTANHTFFLKYNEYAGDMLSANTNALWGVSNTGGESDSPRGDRKIAARYEGVRSWQHLKLAKILNGSYDGTDVDAEVPGIMVGESRYADNAGFNPHTLGTYANQWNYGSRDVYDIKGPTVFLFGKTDTADNSIVDHAILTPRDAYNIDFKYDDGLPNRGKILGDNGEDVGNSQCTDLAGMADDYNAPGDDGITYTLTATSKKCRMMFMFR